MQAVPIGPRCSSSCVTKTGARSQCSTAETPAWPPSSGKSAMISDLSSRKKSFDPPCSSVKMLECVMLRAYGSPVNFCHKLHFFNHAILHLVKYETFYLMPLKILHKLQPENYIKQRRDTFVFYALILLALVESKKMRLNQNKLSL